jgi:dienelactone hydrolase
MVAMRIAYYVAILTLFTVPPATAAISSRMIVETRDITAVSTSPDGRLAVVGICLSNPDTNKRELSWALVQVHNQRAPIVIPAGDEVYDPSAPGALLIRQPLWSRDGRWFFYLRRDGEEVQLWETRSDGKMTRQVTHSTSDLIDLVRSSDPDKFLVQLAPARAALRKAEQDESQNGIVYDDAVIGGFPLTRTLPFIDRWRSIRLLSANGVEGWVPTGWTGKTAAVFDVPHRKLQLAESGAPTAFNVSEGGPAPVTVLAMSPMSKDPKNYAGKYTLQLMSKTGTDPVMRCEIAECIADRIKVIGWSSDGAEIYYLADSVGGPLGERYPGGAAIYAWNPHRNSVRTIHDSGNEGLWGRLYNLHGFAGLSFEPGPIAGREIVVAFSAADQPPRLEAIDLNTGITRNLFDPNSELRRQTAGRAVWHTWKSSIGYDGRGIMILPDDYRSGEKFPLVITTYSCAHGLLHGGGSDGPPEFVLAHHGFIAVCVDIRVREVLARETDLTRIYPIICGIVSGLIADLARDGKVDPARVGLSGQSLGANAGTYCISHSNEFSAAAFRHGSAIERASRDLFETSAYMRGPKSIYAWMNLPDPHHDPTGRWDEISVSRRAREINTPTLIQADDTEYLESLPLWSAMHEEGKPIEMDVFPDETHQLIQPTHMLKNYERQVDWFRFWLRHEEDPAAAKRDQYVRWTRLRDLPHNTLSPQ